MTKNPIKEAIKNATAEEKIQFCDSFTLDEDWESCECDVEGAIECFEEGIWESLIEAPDKKEVYTIYCCHNFEVIVHVEEDTWYYEISLPVRSCPSGDNTIAEAFKKSTFAEKMDACSSFWHKYSYLSDDIELAIHVLRLRYGCGRHCLKATIYMDFEVELSLVKDKEGEWDEIAIINKW